MEEHAHHDMHSAFPENLGPHQHTHRGRSSGSFTRGVITAVFLIILALGSGYYFSKSNPFSHQKKVNAVFLSSGQVFFGTITKESRDYLDLADVYFVQMVPDTTAPAPAAGQQAATKPILVKKGSEAYGPTSSMRINRSQIAYIEELRSDSDFLKQMQGEATK